MTIVLELLMSNTAIFCLFLVTCRSAVVIERSYVMQTILLTHGSSGLGDYVELYLDLHMTATIK